MEDGGLCKQRQQQPWRALEFYSGIAGMRYSAMKAGLNIEMVEAFDINDLANDVYEHNFGHQPFQMERIFSLMNSNGIKSGSITSRAVQNTTT